MNLLMQTFTVNLDDPDAEQQLDEAAWRMFAGAHPVEAYAHDPEKFWNFFHEMAPKKTRGQMLRALKKCQKES